MNWLRRFLSWIDDHFPELPRAPDPGPIPEFEPCGCSTFQPAQAIHYGHISDFSPSTEQLREVVIWNELIASTPPERLQPTSRWTQ